MDVPDHARIRAQLSLYRGVELDTAEDGFFARFDVPARAHGECELLEGEVARVAVSVGARVAARAGAGEVAVRQTVMDLVAGSGIEFEDRGGVELKGLPDEWRLYAVAGGT